MIRHIRPVHHRPLSNTTCFAVALTLLALTVGCGDDSAATDAAGQGANGQGANGQGANGQGANGQGGEGAAGGADVTFEDVTVQVTKVEYASFDGFGNVLGHGVNGDLLEPGCATFSEPVQFTDVGSSVGGVEWMEDDEEEVLVVGVPAGEQADQLAAIQTEFAGGDSVQRSRDYLYVGYRPWGFDTADGVKANDSPDCGDEVVNLIHPKRAFAFVIREVYPSPEVSESFSTPAYSFIYGTPLDQEKADDLSAFDEAGGTLELLVAVAGAHKNELDALAGELAEFEGEAVSIVALKNAVKAAQTAMGEAAENGDLSGEPTIEDIEDGTWPILDWDSVPYTILGE